MGRSFLASLALLLGLLAAPAAAQTTVPGGMLPSQTWALAGSPYLVTGDVTVPAGETLVIEPGVTVQFAATDDQAAGRDATRAELTVAGALVAAGTVAAPVTFTGASPTPGAWYGIVMGPTAAGSVLSNVLVDGPFTGLLLQAAGANSYDAIEVRSASGTGAMIVAGSPAIDGLRVVGAGGAGIYVAAASPTLRACEVRGGATHGVVVTGGLPLTLTLDHCTIAGNAGRGVYDGAAAGSVLNVTGTIVAGNGGEGIFRGLATVNVTYSDVWGHAVNYQNATPGLGSVSANPLFVSPADLALTSNSPARFGAADGSDMGARPFAGAPTPGLQGTLWADTLLAAADGPHDVVGDLTVAPGVTLTIQAGTTLRFAATDAMGSGADAARAELTILGTLHAGGTGAAPILLTGASATPGSWRGVTLGGASFGSVLTSVSVSFAVYGLHVATAGINTLVDLRIDRASSRGLWLAAGSPEIQGLSVTEGGFVGVYVEDASPTLRSAVVSRNASAGVVFAPVGARILTLERCTVAFNGNGGVQGGATVSTLVLRDSIVAGNTGTGVQRSGGTFAVTYSDVWGNSTNYSGASAGTGCITANPLFVAPPEQLRLTSNSPARNSGSGGGDMGALPYLGDATPTLQGTLWAHTTLALAGSPYLVTGDLTVPPGVTLTIEPGVALAFAATDAMVAGTNVNKVELMVHGALVAAGTVAAPIQLSPASGTPGSWYGLFIAGDASGSTLEHLVLTGPQNGLTIAATAANSYRSITVRDATAYGAWVTGGSPTLEDFRAIGCGSGGLYVSGGTPTFSRCVLQQGTTHGAVFNPSAASSTLLDHCTIALNGQDGVRSFGTANAVTVTNSIVASNVGYGLYRGAGTLSVTASDVWGNATDYFNAAAGIGTISANPLFADPPASLRLTSNSPARFGASDGSDMGALPYVADPTSGLLGTLWSDTTLTLAGSPYTVTGDLTIPPGVTLTIEPGATLAFASTDRMAAGLSPRTELIVEGRLLAPGTAQAPITLRGIDGMNWHGVVFAAGSTGSSLSHAELREPMNGVVVATMGTVTLSDVSVLAAGTFGAWLQDGAPVLERFRSLGSTSGGIYVTGGNPLVSNCLLTGSTNHGLTVYASSESLATLDHCTIVGNGGNGIHAFYSPGAFMVTNSIIALNRGWGVRSLGAAGTVLWTDVASNDLGNWNGVAAGTGCLASDPLFAEASDFRLQAGSPCIDAGQGGAATDIDGIARPVDGDRSGAAQTDMGAWEFVPPVVCGDGFVEGTEQCDDGNAVDTDGCPTTCVPAACGDGFVHAGVEPCDDGNAIETDACLTGCVPATCGDGHVQAGVETCDDGNLDDGDACPTTCVPANCGDGFVRAGVESCDDGNGDDTDACLSTCAAATCGDGHVQAGVETCDDGNLDDGDACTNACAPATCGDGIVQADVEECDDGNADPDDACRSNCLLPRCGDGVVRLGVEGCDDGNAVDFDACTNGCEPAACGDGIVEAGVEGCDDGNAVAGDGCSASCAVEPPPDAPASGCGGCGSAGGAGSPLLVLLGLLLARRRRA